MNFEELKQIPLLQTSSIAEACQDAETLKYILACLARYYAGDFGEVCEEDTLANLEELAEGYGHVLARYKQAKTLNDEIYIESHFDKDNLTDINYTNTLIMYTFER